MSKINVLLIDGWSRQLLPFAKAFKNLNCNVYSIVNSRLDVGYLSRYVDKRILRKKIDNNEISLLNEILDIAKKFNIDIVMPLTDFSAKVSSLYKEKIEKYSFVVVNSWEIHNMAYDKYETMKFCMKNNIPCIKTMLNVNSLNDILNSEIGFPIVIKPKSSHGAIGFNIVYSENELEKINKKIKGDFQNYIFQEYIPQSDLQYEMAIYADRNSNVCTSVLFEKNRWFPVKGGSSTFNMSVYDEEISNICNSLMTKLGWKWTADIDLITDPRDGLTKVLEINPRVSASVKIVFLANVNIAKQILESFANNKVTEYSTYKEGVRLRSFLTDTLWFFKSKSRFKSKPSWFNFWKNHDQVFSLSDPLPFFGFLLKSLLSYKREMKKREGVYNENSNNNK